jgi:hypothetical protein
MVLWWIQASNGSQWNVQRSEVTWENLERLNTKLQGFDGASRDPSQQRVAVVQTGDDKCLD